MAWLFLCKKTSDYEIPTSKCIVNIFFFICNTFLIFCLLYQILIRVIYFRIPLKLTTIIFYLLLFQSIIYEIYIGFESFVWAYIIEIYIRHVCFIYMMFFFSLKAWKLHEYPHKNKIIAGIALFFFLYFTGVLISTLIGYKNLLFCKDISWLSLSVTGILLSFAFLAIAYKLSVGVKKKMRYFGIYDNLGKTELANHILETNSFVKKRLEVKMEYVWKIVLYMSLSHFLSFCNYIFYIFNENSINQNCQLLLSENDNGFTNEKIIYLNILVMIIVKIICYFLPIIVVILTFWMKNGDPTSGNIDEEDEITFFKNLTFHNSISEQKKANDPISFSSSSCIVESNPKNQESI